MFKDKFLLKIVRVLVKNFFFLANLKVNTNTFKENLFD